MGEGEKRAFKIEIREVAFKAIKKLPEKDKIKVVNKINSLVNNPLPNDVQKLKGKREILYRIRQGDYRIIYAIHSSVITVEVLFVGNRKEIYKQLK